MSDKEERDGVELTNLDQPLFKDAGATKRDLVDYLDAVADRLIPELADRPLSVIRVVRGQQPFMQKNVPKYTPEWVRTVSVWAEASKREVSYALCNDRRTLLWFANQRAVEYHPTLVLAERWDHTTHLVLDLDPPTAEGFREAARAAHLVRETLVGAGLQGAVKTSGAKDREGKVFIDSTRAGGATVVSAYSPRIRPGVPISFPVEWSELDSITPADFTIHTAAKSILETDPWARQMPKPQGLPADLIEEGRAIPIARVRAMHEGKRRKRERGR